jgi:flagellin-like protein
MIKKKAVSPIISVILIILVTVILTTIFLTWGKTSLKENLQDSQDALKPVGDIDCFKL